MVTAQELGNIIRNLEDSEKIQRENEKHEARMLINRFVEHVIDHSDILVNAAKNKQWKKMFTFTNTKHSPKEDVIPSEFDKICNAYLILDKYLDQDFEITHNDIRVTFELDEYWDDVLLYIVFDWSGK